MYIYIYLVPELQMSITADNGVNAFVTFKLLTKPLHIQIWNEFSWTWADKNKNFRQSFPWVLSILLKLQ